MPQYIIQELSDNRNSPSTYQQEKNAKITALLAETSGPVARAAVGKQLAAVGLGWIMPVEAGYQPPSTSSIFASEAKALGKLAANAGIFLGKVSDQMGSNLASLGGASVKSPENKDVYYEPANDVEALMMHQGSDAATWGLGEGAGKGIARAIEWLGSKAAGQAGRSVSGLEATNTPTSRVAPGQAADAGAKSETGTSLYSYYPPNDGFLGPVVEETLPVGTRIDRYGTETGAFAAPEGTPVWMRSLVPGTLETKPYNVYEVTKPVKVLSGKSTPWFGQGGGGTQYKFRTSIGDAVDLWKDLRRLTE
ncbi:TNT domain-containing protein [Mesorhizobium comanense]|uniref:TNT domain-containing protein n=1 Tax=Mesorhizobium comanense TaxID=2502215 RepID=UPI0010F76B2F|nr:TNT domain-containing protein [Mesorhizobium comanense]